MANLVQNMLSGILKMIDTSGFLTAPESTKFVFGRGSAPDPAGGAYDAPPDPLVGWGNPLPIPTPSTRHSTPLASRTPTPRTRRLRRLCLQLSPHFQKSGYATGLPFCPHFSSMGSRGLTVQVATHGKKSRQNILATP